MIEFISMSLSEREYTQNYTRFFEILPNSKYAGSAKYDPLNPTLYNTDEVEQQYGEEHLQYALNYLKLLKLFPKRNHDPLGLMKEPKYDTRGLTKEEREERSFDVKKHYEKLDTILRIVRSQGRTD